MTSSNDIFEESIKQTIIIPVVSSVDVVTILMAILDLEDDSYVCILDE